MSSLVTCHPWPTFAFHGARVTATRAEWRHQHFHICPPPHLAFSPLVSRRHTWGGEKDGVSQGPQECCFPNKFCYFSGDELHVASDNFLALYNIKIVKDDKIFSSCTVAYRTHHDACILQRAIKARIQTFLLCQHMRSCLQIKY